MLMVTAIRIRDIWDELETDESDVTTERLMAMVAERVRMEKIIPDCDDGHVCDALFKTNPNAERHQHDYGRSKQTP